MGTQQLLSFINFETRKNSAPDHSYQDQTSRSFDTFLDFHQISADKVFIAQLLCIHSLLHGFMKYGSMREIHTLCLVSLPVPPTM